METLKKLTPAEVLLLRDHSRVILKDLLKYTLIDLIVKKVLIVEEEGVQSHPSNPIRTLSYVSIGPYYKDYKFKKHELVYANPFLGNNDIRIQFRHLIKMGFENARGLKSFVYDRLFENTQVNGSLKNSFFNRLFVYFQLTPSGKVKSQQIVKELEELQNSLQITIEKNPEEGKKILQELAGNIFLLDGFDFKILEKIEGEMAEEMRRQRETSGDYGCAGCYIYFDTYSSSFDSEVSSGGSGCGGFSGCSGCSGCGGCGGCGS